MLTAHQVYPSAIASGVNAVWVLTVSFLTFVRSGSSAARVRTGREGAEAL